MLKNKLPKGSLYKKSDQQVRFNQEDAPLLGLANFCQLYAQVSTLF